MGSTLESQITVSTVAAHSEYRSQLVAIHHCFYSRTQSSCRPSGFPVRTKFGRGWTIEEGFIQKRTQRSSLLFGGQNSINSFLCTRTICRIGWIHPFLHIILVHFILFFMSSWCKIATVVRNWSYSVPKPSLLQSVLGWSVDIFFDRIEQGK